jgi:hypothetical protein
MTTTYMSSAMRRHTAASSLKIFFIGAEHCTAPHPAQSARPPPLAAPQSEALAPQALAHRLLSTIARI